VFFEMVLIVLISCCATLETPEPSWRADVGSDVSLQLGAFVAAVLLAAVHLITPMLRFLRGTLGMSAYALLLLTIWVRK
jgi:hypothetical protein